MRAARNYGGSDGPCFSALTGYSMGIRALMGFSTLMGIRALLGFSTLMGTSAPGGRIQHVHFSAPDGLCGRSDS